MPEPGPMIKVEVKPGDVRRVSTRDLAAFMAAYPGAHVVDDAPEAKAVKPAANKAVSKAPGDK